MRRISTNTSQHPIHIHLVDFKVISRTSGNNARTVMPYESGLKDVVWLGRRETVVVEAHYAVSTVLHANLKLIANIG